MKTIKHTELREILSKIDTPIYYKASPRRPTKDEVNILREALLESLDPSHDSEVSVLGLDIFKYSQFEPLNQKLVPFVFRFILEKTAGSFLDQEPILGSFYEPDSLRSERFIDTGDGGFVILRTPLDALTFAMLFALNLQEFNSYHNFPKLREMIGPLTVRYAITTDKIYKSDDNYYGPSIIRNARILSKDKLNRCLMDSTSYNWFLLHTNGVESLRSITKREIRYIEAYKTADSKIDKSLFFESLEQNAKGLMNLIVQKLENISAKEQDFEVYNMMMQVTVNRYIKGTEKVLGNLTATLGNLNTTGL